MGAVAVTARRRKGFGSEFAVCMAGLLLVLLVLSRYLVNGEPVDVRSDPSAMTASLSLSDGAQIRQPLTVPEGMNWRQGYYALRFAVCDPSSAGQVICTVEQGETVETVRIPLHEIQAGKWFRVDGLDLDRLECGEALLRLTTEGVAEGELAVAAGPDYYGFGTPDHSRGGQDLTLAQAYHCHGTGMEYRIRLLCYGIVILCAAGLALSVGSNIGSNRKCLAAFVLLTILFMAVIYLLDSSIYLEPTYAEAVTNFLHYAREEKLMANLPLTDAGYLPLLPRLIVLFYVKVLRVPAIYALYFMQITACLLCSMVWSFFVLPPFRRLMCLSGRILWCILVMLTCFCEETLFFTNHAYWGIYLLLLLLLAADLEIIPGWIYAGLLGVSALLCLSKGTYAVMLPLMLLYLLFFGRSIGKRNKVFAFVAGAASLLQILYSFGGQGDGGSWVKTASVGQIGYWLRLIGRTFTDFAAYLLTPLGRNLQRMPGLVVVLAFLVFAFLIVDFTGTVLIPVLRGRRIDRYRTAFYTAVMFQLIVSAFFLLTVKSVPDSWNDIGKITPGQMGHKYEIFSNIGFYMLLLTGGVLLYKGSGEDKEPEIDRAGDWIPYGVLALMVVFCLTSPVMKLSGWKDAGISDSRVYAGDINAGWQGSRELIKNSAFFVPVRADNWGYCRNATVYQEGTDTYFEETSCINLEGNGPEGYHSEYEIPETVRTQNLIEVMIEQPARIDRPILTAQVLDEEGGVIAEARQTQSGADRNRKCLFYLGEPVVGGKTIRFLDENEEPVYFKDYIAWVCAW